MKNIARPKINDPQGRVDFKTFRSVMVKFLHTTIGTPAEKGIFKPSKCSTWTITIMGKPKKSTSARQLMDEVRTQLQEAAT